MDTNILVLNQFMSGAIMMSSLCAGIFFLKFWRKTDDRFFAMFASSFFLLAIERWLFAFMPTTIESSSWIYFIRLLAFLLILVAVIDKNRA